MKLLKFSILLFASLFMTFSLNAQESKDNEIFESFFKYASSKNLAGKSCGERVAGIASFFLGTPYKGGTLEADGPERLQVNLRELDCTTFVENILALNLTIESGKTDFDSFRENLQKIRYRNGIIDGYSSRLHYITDWIKDNRKKRIIGLVSLGKDSKKFLPKVNYMSTHPEAYPALKANPEFVKVMADIERAIGMESLRYLPKDMVEKNQGKIHEGDIIAITTSLPGMDFSHLGIAVKGKDGKIYLLHASSTAKEVVISKDDLGSYLSGISKHTGVVIVRPL